MAVVAIFKYDIKPGRLPDFMKKLAEAADPKFSSDVMPTSIRMFRSTVPGPDHGVILMIEYPDMAAYGARTAFENANSAWRRLFEPTRDSPETLVSVELLTEITPEAAEVAPDARVTFGFRPA
jgi:NIPSNAP